MKEKLKVLILAGNTLRARAYAQMLGQIEGNNFEIKGLFYGFDTKECVAPTLNKKTENYFMNEGLFLPNFEESLQITYKKNNWTYIEVNNSDVNSEDVLGNLNTIESDIIVFAGYGGQLLKGMHFVSGRKYLHMHPGELPAERGSTTLYYSILNKRLCTVSAFYMTEKIDDGANILFCSYQVPGTGVDIDRWLDNVIRADCFVKALERIENNIFEQNEDHMVSEEYYVIHPVLKHVALLSLK